MLVAGYHAITNILNSSAKRQNEKIKLCCLNLRKIIGIIFTFDPGLTKQQRKMPEKNK